MEILCYECQKTIQRFEELKEINENQELSPSIYENMKKSERIESLASSAYTSEHLICFNCVKLVKQALESQSASKRSEQERLEAFYESMPRATINPPNPDELESLQAKLIELKKQEKQQKKQIESLSKELSSISEQENALWLQASQYELTLMHTSDQNAEINNRESISSQELKKIQGQSLINHLFFIDASHEIAKISGFRIGKLSHCEVSWEEINAGIGQCVLLLSTLSRLVRYQSACCNLYPLGAYSRISNIENDANRYELYCSDSVIDTTINRFNQGLSLFLRAVQEYSLYVNRQSLPYKIDGNLIGGVYIGFTHDQEWTKAMRYLLCNLNHLMKNK